jgi:prevent-host-death family protein
MAHRANRWLRPGGRGAMSGNRKLDRRNIKVYNMATNVAILEGQDMSRVGIRELRDQATGIIRDVRENRAEYVVTYHGRPVAVLLPVDEGWLEGETQHAIEAATSALEARSEMEPLRQEIARGWKSPKTAVELVSGQRR